MPTTIPAEIKKLLTAAELKLVESSQQPTLSKLSEAKLKKNITLTRRAGDKWRDQSTRQRRDVQRAQGSRTTDAAARSADKTTILTTALNDLQTQLDKIASGATTAGTKAPAAKSPGKAKRAEGHRASRAEVRASLEEKRGKLTGTTSAAGTPKKTAKKKWAKKKGAANRAATEGLTTKKKTATNKVHKKTTTKSNKTTTSAKKKAAEKKKAAVKRKAAVKKKEAVKKQAVVKKTAKKNSVTSRQPAVGQAAGLTVNQSDQRSTQTKAKKARIRESGLTTRTRGHVSARGKRSQGRRDNRR